MPSQSPEFEGLLEAVPDALVAVDGAGVIRFVNRRVESMFGYEPNDLVGKPVETLVPQSLRPLHVAHRQDYDASPGTRHMGTDLQLSGQRRDGTEFPVDIALSPMDTGERRLVIAAVRDMTFSRRTEAERRRAERLAAIVEGSDDAIVSVSLDGLITSWNPAAERMYGYRSEEIIGKSAEIMTPAESTGEIKTILARIKAGERVVRLETKRVRKDGTVLPVSLTVSPIHSGSAELVGTSVIHRDLTRNGLTFESARSMIETSLDSFVVISPEGKITDANEATVRLTGVARDKLIGTSFSDYFTDPKKAAAIYRLVFTEKRAVEYPLTLRHRGEEETLTEVLYNASVYRDSSGTVLGVFAAARDVTERIMAQREAAHQQAIELDRLAELEHFHRLTVGRELKMIELKKEIEYLRNLQAAQPAGPKDKR
jgi:PAS domain S-box-containing protein